MIKTAIYLAKNILIKLDFFKNINYNYNNGGDFMNKNSFIITSFLSASKPINQEGRSFYMHKRTSSALIFPLYGKIEFSWNNEVICLDALHPVFVPKGISYLNNCVESAQSIMFNIEVQNPGNAMIPLSPSKIESIEQLYEDITILTANSTMKKQAKLFEKLYKILAECLPSEPGDKTSVLSPALEIIEKNYHLNELSLDMLAKSCYISKSYLHKLFQKELGITPFQYINKIRMKHAKTLLHEMYPVGEVALMVGYSDIFQFSRAFKRFYNCSPKKMKESFL